MCKKKRIEIMELEYRIKELENILCPAEQHDYVSLSRTVTSDDGISFYTKNNVICRRCLHKETLYEH